VLLGSIGQKAEVTDTHEAIGEHVEEKTADELLGIEEHRFQPVFVSSIPVPPEADQPLAEAKSDLAVFDGEDPVIGQSHAVGVTAEVVKDCLWRTERLLRIDHPVLFTQRIESLACGRDFPLVASLL